ncbi:MAG: xanthine dehydrogenase family protein molybdopterin-binding subunit [Burkholderiales bacterium]|nr:xanthine dehydrogenase family protein molybdopterin-binding subunit [Burkholderiales bacterium]
MRTLKNSSRRDFLKTSAALSGALMVGFSIPSAGKTAATVTPINGWVRVGSDNTVTIICHRAEMGQGTYTSMPMLVAEELEVDLRRVKIEMAGADPIYINALLGGQLTGGSTSVRDAFDGLRKAGAQARMMLISAAAQEWKIPESDCRADNGVIFSKGGKKLFYGQLAPKAAQLPVPKDVVLKDAKAWKIIGRPVKRLDTPAKVTGKAEYGIDVQLPGMLIASLAQCPVLGGKPLSVDDTKAKTMPGVIAVVKIDDGVAVVAKSFWQAKTARDALNINWDFGKGASLSSAGISQGLKDALAKPAAMLKKTGDVDKALAGAARKMTASYELPFLAHATMEPMNFTADVRKDGCDIYGPTQFPQLAEGVAMQITGLPKEKVTVHTTFLGGGFGRRIDVDFIVQAVQISKAVGKPVKLIWTREDDMTHDFYRPVSLNTLEAGLDASGKPVAMKFRLTSPSVTARLFPPVVKDGIDPFMTEASVLPYDIPNTAVEMAIHDAGVRVGYWRSVSHALNCFANESFIDELAAAAGKDPVAYRMAMLNGEGSARFRSVMNIAATKAGWGKAPAGRFQGVALMEGYGTYVAQIAEISIDKGEIRVHKVTCAVDCGTMVNPDIVKAQVESSVAYGMSAVLLSRITFKDGRVEQSNFHDYPVMRMNQMPVVDVFMVSSLEKPGGIGEPVVATCGPSVANAVFAATGKRVRKLPIEAADLKSA